MVSIPYQRIIPHKETPRTGWRSEMPLPDTPPPEEFYGKHLPESDHHVLSPVQPKENAVVAIIGVGYVGLHLVNVFAPHYDVIAFDVSESRLKAVSSEIGEQNSITWTREGSSLTRATHILIAVPTSLLPDKSIDTTYVQEAIRTISNFSRPGATVVMESSVGVGMTRRLLESAMRSRDLKAGMSPERVDPGRTEPAMEAIPKIISGLDDITSGSLDSINDLYSRVFKNVVKVSRPEVAEMTKLYENCQRMVCIAYANEMAEACIPHGIDPFEVARAAATKPFGYLPFMPSLGVGGPCIPVNPYYLLSNSNFPLLKAATEKMYGRPSEVGNRAMRSLFQQNPGKFERQKPRILIVGAGFKRGQSLVTQSPGVELMKSLVGTWDVHVSYADPLVDDTSIPSIPRLGQDEWNKESLSCFDMIIVAVRQDGLDFSVLEELEGVQIETWA